MLFGLIALFLKVWKLESPPREGEEESAEEEGGVTGGSPEEVENISQRAAVKRPFNLSNGDVFGLVLAAVIFFGFLFAYYRSASGPAQKRLSALSC